MESVKTILTVCFLIFIIETAYAEELGHIQVKCEPGIQVYLDGDFKGITDRDIGGLIIENVKAGKYVLRVVKKGFNPQEKQVQIAPGQVATIRISAFVPGIEIKESGESVSSVIQMKVGELAIQSLPVECTISSPRLGLQNTRKTKDLWEAKRIPAGGYDFSFSALGKSLRKKIEIKQNLRTKVMVNFLRETVKVTHPDPLDTIRTICDPSKRYQSFKNPVLSSFVGYYQPYFSPSFFMDHITRESAKIIKDYEKPFYDQFSKHFNKQSQRQKGDLKAIADSIRNHMENGHDYEEINEDRGNRIFKTVLKRYEAGEKEDEIFGYPFKRRETHTYKRRVFVIPASEFHDSVFYVDDSRRGVAIFRLDDFINRAQNYLLRFFPKIMEEREDGVYYETETISISSAVSKLDKDGVEARITIKNKTLKMVAEDGIWKWDFTSERDLLKEFEYTKSALERILDLSY